MIARIFAILIIIALVLVISMNKAEAWVGGRLSIESPTNGERISGKSVFIPEIIGDKNVSNTRLYGKSRDTNINEFKLFGENISCGSWNADEGIPCSIIIDTKNIEDSSIWQFYMTAENNSNSGDIVKSSTITEVTVDNTKPAFQLYTFLSPQDGEIIETNSVGFGALVEPELTTHCFIEFTSNANPGQREYKTDIEKNEYCNVTIPMVAEGVYIWNIRASDGKQETSKINGGKFEVRSPKDISKFEQTEPISEKGGLPESSNIVLIAIAVIFILILLGRRR